VGEQRFFINRNPKTMAALFEKMARGQDTHVGGLGEARGQKRPKRSPHPVNSVSQYRKPINPAILLPAISLVIRYAEQARFLICSTDKIYTKGQIFE
jgi:hypothetical protein